MMAIPIVSGPQIKSRRKYGVLWFGGLGLLAVTVYLSTTDSPTGEKAQTEQQAAKQREFEKTPEGKKAKAAKEKEQIQELSDMYVSNAVEKYLLNAGYDTKVYATGDKMFITGEQMNRVVANRFMQQSTIVKQLREASLKTVTFTNGHQLTGIYIETYSIAK